MLKRNSKFFLIHLLFPLFLVGLAAYIPKTELSKSTWQLRMDAYIKRHLEEALFHISFQSIDNSFEQYYRNANLPISSIDVIKLPIVYEILWQSKKKDIDLKKLVVITEEQIRQNQQGFFGKEDIGKSFSLSQVVEASMAFNDNAASNILLDEVGYQRIIERLRDKDLNNVYIKSPLVDSLKNERTGTTNFITSGDMLNLMKKIQSERKLKNKDWLFDQLALNAQKNGNFGLEGGTIVGIAENTKLSKGFLAMVEKEEKHSYILAMFVTNFKSEADASRLLNDMMLIFKGENIADDDSIQVANQFKIKN